MLQPGDRVGRYEIQRRLGRGGMGTVYVAHDPTLGRLVAIKVFAGDLDAADAAGKFAREARAAAALNHPHIVTIHDFGEFELQPYIVMEYIQGDTVARLIRNKPEMSLPERLRLIEELCLGAAYAHGFHVIHRDIKPANLMVDRAGRLKILEFGIARMLGSSMSRGTMLIGTPGYMAPEQIRGGPLDERADIFSIGVVAYELLTYAEAFPGDSLPAITHAVLSTEPASLTQIVPEIPDALVAIVERAMEKNASLRFSDASALGAAVAQIRRQVEAEPRWQTVAPTLPGRAPLPNRASGVGSAPGPQSTPLSGPGSLTPGEASRAGREELARRRTAQIETALAAAKAQLQQGLLQEALESCLQALTFDDAHAGALQIERDIRVAMARQRAATLVADARGELARGAITLAQNMFAQARELDPEAADVRQLDRELRMARVEEADARARTEDGRRAVTLGRAALERGDAEGALTAARQALRVDPASPDARQLETEAMTRIDAEVGAPTVFAPTRVAPGPRPVATPPVAPSPSRTSTPAWAALLTSLRVALTHAGGSVIARGARLSTIARRIPSAAGARSLRGIAAVRVMPAYLRMLSPGRVRRLSTPALAAWLLGGTLVAGVAAASAMKFFQAPPAAPVRVGSVRIDATPWATVTAIASEDGSPQPLPENASTPLIVQLPVGRYRITLAGPPPHAATHTMTVAIEGDRVAVVEPVEFPTLSVDEYFSVYLPTAGGSQ